MSDLTGLPEIGTVTASQLVAVGISDADTLREVGAPEAFVRIRDQLDPGACLQLFTGLECAVRGIRSGQLTPQDRAELRARFRALPTPR
ncbi:TfoX/Sxy family DNA transformation protein [Actinomyces polynesiensis]|uniref:TfoX/Sxy family DNA transformation protein n=1 Tax=Actinomyces polynesiensis TaxID=1325934 RepID=UPI0005B87BDE|nr:TfoX/Sxy family DNA transformation protein [Actinomyces polynesiensis]